MSTHDVRRRTLKPNGSLRYGSVLGSHKRVNFFLLRTLCPVKLMLLDVKFILFSVNITFFVFKSVQNKKSVNYFCVPITLPCLDDLMICHIMITCWLRVITQEMGSKLNYSEIVFLTNTCMHPSLAIFKTV